jgi:molybdate transport repressor ModE-like protein
MVAALIIAAGKTARESGFEPLIEVGTITAIKRIVMVFQRAGIERVVVVCEGGESKTEKLTAHMNIVYLSGREDIEMLDNIKIGLTYLSGKCTSALITHVGVPLFSVETVRALINAKNPVCIPTHRGKAGHPILLRSEHFSDILSYSGDSGLAGAVKVSGLRSGFVEVEDEGILTNVHGGTEYGHLLAEHNLRKLYPDIKVRITREKPFYGPGSHLLLQLTHETGSLREACRHMGISYGKGRMIIKRMEQQLEYAVIESQQGGRKGGKSVVTAEARKLMRNYTEFLEESKQCVNEIFLKHFTP